MHADAGAAQLMGTPQHMLAALRRLGGMAPGALPQNVATAGITGRPGWMALFSSHPPLEERIAALALALTNQVLSAVGKPMLPIESAQLEQLISSGLTVAAALASWWNNNSFTPEAIEADDFMTRLKQQKR